MTSTPSLIKTVLQTDANWTNYGSGETEPNNILMLTELNTSLTDPAGVRHYNASPAIIIGKDTIITERRSHTKDLQTSYVPIRVSSTTEDAADSLYKAVQNILVKAGVTGFEAVWTEQIENLCDGRKKRFVFRFNLYLTKAVDNS